MHNPNMQNDQTTGQAPRGNTPVTLNTDGLVNDLLAIGPGLKVAAEAFRPNEGNYMRCAGHGIRLISDAWKRFENGTCRVITELRASLRATIANWDNEVFSLTMTRNRELAHAKETLTQAVTTAINAELDAEATTDEVDGTVHEAAAEVQTTDTPIAPAQTATPAQANYELPTPPPVKESALKTAVNGLRVQLENVLIAATGHIDGHMVVRGLELVFKVAITIGAIYAISEMAGALGYFNAKGTGLEALGFSALLIMIGTIMADISGVHMRQFTAILDADRARKRAFPKRTVNGVEIPEGCDDNGQPVPREPLTLSVILMGPVLFAGLFALAAGVLAWRLNMAKTDPALEGTEFKGWLLSVGLLVNAVIVYYVAPLYREETVKRYVDTKKEYEEKKPLLEAEEAADKVRRDQAIADANAAVEKAQEHYHNIADILEQYPEVQGNLEDANNAYDLAQRAAETAEHSESAEHAEFFKRIAEREQTNAARAYESANRTAHRIHEQESAEEAGPAEESAPVADPNNPMQNAWIVYERKVAAANGKVERRLEELVGRNGDVNRYRILMSMYHDTFRTTLEPATGAMMTELNRLIALRMKKEGKPFDKDAIRAQYAAEVASLRDQTCPLALEDPEFDQKELAEFKPTIELQEDEIVTDFDGFVEEIRNRLRSERIEARTRAAEEALLEPNLPLTMPATATQKQ